MQSDKDRARTVTLLLGAGASRGVSYADEMFAESPLDSDFFDILQRLELKGNEPWKIKFRESKEFVLKSASDRPGDALWRSLEKMFYTLHLSAVVEHKLFPDRFDEDPAKLLLKHFARALQGTLRAAHKKNVCEHHVRLLQRLQGSDSIVTFNYDLVTERALIQLCKDPKRMVPFGKWLYGFERKPDAANHVPTLHKLHGSVNWKLANGVGGQFKRLELRGSSWNFFDRMPGYVATGPSFPILLPYWEKRIEQEPWRGIWSRAAARLLVTSCLIVWGYSLPLSDLKAKELLRLTVQRSSSLSNVCVIDPSKETRDRWRAMFVNQHFWPFAGIEDFFTFLERHNAGALSLGPLSPR